jgi:hypothetical protein
MSDRRPSSTVTRRRCYDYWKQPDGGLICYICKRHFTLAEVKQTKPPLWDAEHEIPRSISLDPNKDLPPNVKPACRPTCENHEYGHAEKTRKDIKSFAKVQRHQDKEMGFSRGRGKPIPGSIGSGLRRRYDRRQKRWITVRVTE